eukprot:COSAG06_NODE_14807_length_1124_cov_1.199024_2_plen_60_part_01
MAWRLCFASSRAAALAVAHFCILVAVLKQPRAFAKSTCVVRTIADGPHSMQQTKIQGAQL